MRIATGPQSQFWSLILSQNSGFSGDMNKSHPLNYPGNGFAKFWPTASRGPLVLHPPTLQAYFQTTGYLWSSLALFEAADLGGCRSFLKSFSGSEAT